MTNPAACIERFDYCAKCDAAITDTGRALNCGFCHDGRLFCGRACATKHMIDKHPDLRAALDAAPEVGERCPTCGVDVVFVEDGRCPNGHAMRPTPPPVGEVGKGGSNG